MKYLKSLAINFLPLSCFLATGLILPAQNNLLENGFKNPPDEAKPRTWWHWTNSNITKEGITKDLEWMKRVGIGGMQLADVAFGQGQTVERKIVFGSKEWFDVVKYAASEAQRLNLEMAIFSSAGWSLTGRPWVKPEQAMKKLVWSDTVITGPGKFRGVLPQPPSCEGPIGNMKRSMQNNGPLFFKNCIVLAFPSPGEEAGFRSRNPVVSTVEPSVWFLTQYEYSGKDYFTDERIIFKNGKKKI